ncbi:MAG: hypothetical protein UT51_C0009G0016 [Candidatus Nomurabacteria bacterium GW2011_GWC2_39_41]|uniref:Uncharacterized protein n=1 Tax=Candidatus Nomurabacteria bacterium GW2011_GWC2_39_41 TaxID=1618754 RepID=A0A837HUZ9_9BACT|nr:MAG: hypothetical protein UT51_C0009G0016 [Candidatus Nomurabacteria bacterium GW2011_GWC2_39_41]
MKITLDIKNLENSNFTPERLKIYEEIITALVSSGGFDGVKGGQTIIHFDAIGQFVGVQLSYWPWRRKRVDK